MRTLVTTSDCTPTHLCLSLGPPSGGKQEKGNFLRLEVPFSRTDVLSSHYRYTLLRCSLASRADKYPVEAFRVMLLLGQETKALGLAELITQQKQRAEVFTLIASKVLQQLGRAREAEQLFLQAEQVIGSISDRRFHPRVQNSLLYASRFGLGRTHRKRGAHLVCSVFLLGRSGEPASPGRARVSGDTPVFSFD